MGQGTGGSEHAPPVIRIAPLGEIRAYTVYEHELDEVARGGSGSFLYLNFGLSLASIFATLLITVLTVTIPAGYLYESFFSACITTGVIAAVLLLVWRKNHKSAARLIDQIKNRMPPAQGIQDSVKPGEPNA